MLVGGTVAVSAIVGLAIAATPSAPVYAGLFLLVAMLFVAMIARSPMARRRRRLHSARFASILFGILLALVAFYNVTFDYFSSRTRLDTAGVISLALAIFAVDRGLRAGPLGTRLMAAAVVPFALTVVGSIV